MANKIAQRRETDNPHRAALVEVAITISHHSTQNGGGEGVVFALSADKKPRPSDHLSARTPLNTTIGQLYAPGSMAGLVTGKKSGITAVDLDLQKVDAALRDDVIERALSRFGHTPFKVNTPSGGCHLMYRYDGERSCDLPDGLPGEIKADGGHIAIAPSMRADGRAYRWDGIEDAITGWALLFSEPETLPRIKSGALDGAKVAPRKQKDQDEQGATVHGFHASEPSSRNKAVYDKLREMGVNMGDDDLRTFGLAFAQDLSRQFPKDHSLTDAETNRTIDRVIRYKREGRLLVKGGEAVVIIPLSLSCSGIDGNTLTLWHVLECSHAARPGAPFAVSPKGMARNQKINGWGEKLYRRCRDDLVRLGVLRLVRQGGLNGKKSDSSQYRMLLSMQAGVPAVHTQSQMTREAFQ